MSCLSCTYNFFSFLVQSPCTKNNAGCHHMCIVTKSSSGNSLAYRCACNMGYQLASDLHNCISKYNINVKYNIISCISIYTYR